MKKRRSARKKLLIIGAVPPPYHGVTLSTKHLLASDLARHFQIIHLDTSDRRDLENLGKFDLINITSALGQVLKLMWWCVTRRPNLLYLVIAQNYGGFLRDGLFILVGRLFSRARIVIHLRGGHFDQFFGRSPSIFQLFIDLAMRSSDHPIVLGENLKYIFSRWFKRDKIFVVPNGTDLIPVVRRQTGHPQDPLIIAYLGNLLRTKGILEVLQSFNGLAAEHPQVKLSMAGAWKSENGEFKTQVLDFIGENNLTEKIEFCGLIHDQDKTNFLRRADIFIFPSYSEGHPNCVLEAMAASLPIVATSVGALPETVSEGENGFLVKPGDWLGLKEKVDLLIRDPQLRIAMGARSRQLIEEKFTRQRNIETLIRVFQQVANGPINNS